MPVALLWNQGKWWAHDPNKWPKNCWQLWVAVSGCGSYPQTIQLHALEWAKIFVSKIVRTWHEFGTCMYLIIHCEKLLSCRMFHLDKNNILSWPLSWGATSGMSTAAEQPNYLNISKWDCLVQPNSEASICNVCNPTLNYLFIWLCSEPKPPTIYRLINLMDLMHFLIILISQLPPEPALANG
jgi:hypothetical protein